MYGSVLITALTLSLICLILLSTTVTASPAAIVSNAVPITANFVSNHTELIAPVIVPGQGPDPTGYRLYRILPGTDLPGTTTVHYRLLYRRSQLQPPRRS